MTTQTDPGSDSGPPGLASRGASSSSQPGAARDPGPPGLASQKASSSSRPGAAEESLADLLGGKRAAIDATLGPLAFGVGYIATNRSVGGAVLTALIVSGVLGIWRLSRGDKPRAVLLGLLGVVVAALIALRTGHAEDFFLIRIATNAASALAWMVSIVVRRPLLGVVVGTVLGQKSRWRRDPGLLRAYSRGSWIWVCQYMIRMAVWLPLWWAGQVVALNAATVALTWPLVAACLAVSWWVIQRTLPSGHPGLRHPRLAGSFAGAESPDVQEDEAGQSGQQPISR